VAGQRHRRIEFLSDARFVRSKLVYKRVTYGDIKIACIVTHISGWETLLLSPYLRFCRICLGFLARICSCSRDMLLSLREQRIDFLYILFFVEDTAPTQFQNLFYE